MKIYTKTGDGGETSLFGAGRVSKADARIEACGSVDELNATLGWAVAHVTDKVSLKVSPRFPDPKVSLKVSPRFPVTITSGTLVVKLTDDADGYVIADAIRIELASPPPTDGRRRPDTPSLPVARISEMESWMDEADGELPELRAFVLPGGTRGAAALHLSRTVCRRAERSVVRLAEAEPLNEELVRYLNRLSDLLFTFARLENHRSNTPDVEWKVEWKKEHDEA